MSSDDRLKQLKNLMKAGYAGIAGGAAIFAAVAIAAMLQEHDFALAGTLVCAVAWGSAFGTIIYSAARKAIAELEARGDENAADER